MKIVYIIDFFHPDAGYQDNILSKYWAQSGNEVIVFTSEIKKIPSGLTKFFDCTNIEAKDRKFEEKNQVQILRIPIIAYKSGRSIYSREIFKQIKRIGPDIIFVNGNDTLIGIQLTLKNRKAPYALVLDSHMLEMASENPYRNLFRFFYRKFITPIIIKENIPVVRTQDDAYVEKNLGIPLDRCPLISFGSDTLLFHPDNDQKIKFRKENNILKEEFVVLYAGKLSKNKGADILAEAVGEEITKKRNVIFIIVGNSTGEFGKFVEKSLKKAKNRVIRFPTQKYENLCGFYQAADIAIFPKECSLSFYDVQACGLPVVFENNDVNISRSQHGNAVVFDSGDAKDLIRKIRMFAEMEIDEFSSYSKNSENFILDGYQYKDKAEEYIALFNNQILKKKGGRK